MANTDSPHGLVPIRHKNGAPYNGAVNSYYIPASYGTALGIGDPVLITGTSNTSGINGYPAGALPEINKAAAAAGGYISGVIVGFDVNEDNLSQQYNPASTERVAFVCDDPDVVFRIQEDGDTTPLAVTSVGLNADLIFTNSVDTATGISGVELDSTTAATTATLKMKILRMASMNNNEIGAYAEWEVMINLHTQRNATGY